MKVSSFTDNMANAPDAEYPLFGVEVEYENSGGMYLPDATCRQYSWAYTDDGSLRNGGVEYISRPLSLSGAIRSFNAVTKWAVDSHHQATVRTGIHVHVDMRRYDVTQVAGAIAAYAAFEPLLFHIVGEERAECVYCVPWYKAPDQAEQAQVFAEGKRHCNPYLVKYSALYLNPLWRFGTIEFRQAPTWMEPEPFRRWICTLNRLVRWGVTQTPETVMAACTGDTNRLVRSIFGWTMRDIPDPERLMDAVDSLAVVDATLPCTYKVGGWGMDVGEPVGEALMYHNPSSVPDPFEEVQLLRATFDEDEYPEPDDYEGEDPDEY